MPKALSSAPANEHQLRQAAHEIKNELASILALTEMLDVMLPELAQEISQPQIQKIRERIKHATETVNRTFQELHDQENRDSLPE